MATWQLQGPRLRALDGHVANFVDDCAPVTAARYVHVGGAILTDHGPIGLGQARHLVAFYEREASLTVAPHPSAWAQTCTTRAETLGAIACAAVAWRRAAGWTDPDQADVAGVPGLD